MLAVARRILGSDDLAWDAVQEAFMCLWHEPSEPADLRAWLVRTVVNKSRHQARSLARRRHHEDEAARLREEWGVDPHEAVEGRELARAILRAVEELPAPFADAFRLCDVEELDYSVAAQHLAIPIGTVRSRIHRARAILRRRLAHLVHDADVCAICVALRQRCRAL